MVINMRYAVDEIIDNYVRLENLDSGDIINVDISLFPKNIKEGNIVVKKEKYIIDYKYERERRQNILDKLNNVK